VTGKAKSSDELASTTTSPPVVDREVALEDEVAVEDDAAFEERVKQLSEKQLRELLLKLKHKFTLPSRGSILFHTPPPPAPWHCKLIMWQWLDSLMTRSAHSPLS